MKNTEEYFLYTCTAILLICYIFASGQSRADNEIFVTQAGDYLVLGAEQIGDNNTATVSVFGYNQQLLIIQDNDTNVENSVSVTALGDNNLMRFCQGCAWEVEESETEHGTTNDGIEGAGHTVQVGVFGSGNRVSGSQTNQGSTSGHEFNLTISADDNDVQFKQQSDGVKTVDLTIYNDENEVRIRQHGNGATHTASIELDGTYGTDLTLKQLGVTTQSYSLQQNCLTAAGCSVSVIQQ